MGIFHRFIKLATKKMTTITKQIKTPCIASTLTAPYMLIPATTPIRNAIKATNITFDIGNMVTPV